MKIFEVANPKDVVAMDVPFLIRALEYAREDAKGDLDLHNAVERMLAAVKGGKPLDMNDYNQVFGGEEDVAEGEVTRTAAGLVHRATDKYGAGDDDHHYKGGRSGFSDPGKYAKDLEAVNKQLVKDLDASMGITWKNRGTKGVEVDEQGVAEGFADEFAKFAQERGGKLRTGPQPTKPATAPAAQPVEPIDRAALEQELKQLSAQLDPNFEYSDDYSFWSKQKAIADRIAGIKKKLGVTEGDISQLEKDIAAAPVEPIANMEADEKIAGRYDADEFDSMVNRLKKLAGAGPLKTVYDPNTRRYKNVPVAQQPGDKK